METGCDENQEERVNKSLFQDGPPDPRPSGREDASSHRARGVPIRVDTLLDRNNQGLDVKGSKWHVGYLGLTLRCNDTAVCQLLPRSYSVCTVKPMLEDIFDHCIGDRWRSITRRQSGADFR